MKKNRALAFTLGGWVTLGVDMPVEEIVRYGPSLQGVKLTPDASFGHDNVSPLPRQVSAQMDTGAEISCISARLWQELGVKPCRFLNANSEASRPVPMCRANIAFQNGTQINADLAVFAQLAQPHDLLIGRDILRLGRIVVDFTTGHWELEFKTG
jgi:hypothetical protein